METDELFDPKYWRQGESGPEMGWECARLRHHLARHGLIRWQAELSPPGSGAHQVPQKK